MEPRHEQAPTTPTNSQRKQSTETHPPAEKPRGKPSTTDRKPCRIQGQAGSDCRQRLLFSATGGCLQKRIQKGGHYWGRTIRSAAVIVKSRRIQQDRVDRRRLRNRGAKSARHADRSGHARAGAGSCGLLPSTRRRNQRLRVSRVARPDSHPRPTPRFRRTDGPPRCARQGADELGGAVGRSAAMVAVTGLELARWSLGAGRDEGRANRWRRVGHHAGPHAGSVLDA